MFFYFFSTTLTNKALAKLFLKVEEASDVLGFALSFELISS